eukprot:gnl/MRDRNA2_/MRDRNA2_29494_c0_seq1.p1 gnl/MRDRNA2_/MRDRNA2_29494_c0~~gnl/MRDRNA2_/MRDRNA2_29494_c0_seq1.p1  ORF type:complete len:431 (+),score=67.68 gnl/MRDRNA2_/MRDRNA2_29494_c0_seq1:114-1406(+)
MSPSWTDTFLDGFLEFLHVEVSSIFRGHFGGARLTPEEEHALWRLKDRHCNQAFDPQNAKVWCQLREIWHAAFPDEAAEITDADARWRRLGFQSSSPCSDIRAGLFALDQLHYLACRYPALLQRLVTEALDLEYPFACACFNVSQVIVLFFNLLSSPAMNPVPEAVQASSTHLKNFAYLCHTCPYGAVAVLHELFCALVERLNVTWKTMRADENCTVMNFPGALREVYVANAAFWRSRHVDIAEIRKLSNHTQIQVTGKSLRTVVKEQCKHLHQAVGTHMTHTKMALAKAFRSQGTSSEVDSMDLRQKLLNLHERSYQPPNVMEVVTYSDAPAMLRRPLAQPVEGFELDAFDALFDNLGLCNKAEKDSPPDVWGQIIALDENENTDDADFHAVLQPCLGPQKITTPKNVSSLMNSNPMEPELLWQDFGNW